MVAVAKQVVRATSDAAEGALKLSRRLVMGALAAQVLVVAVLAMLLAPGVMLDYSGPGLLPRWMGAPRLGAADLKHMMVVALSMSLLNVGLGNVLRSGLRALGL